MPGFTVSRRQALVVVACLFLVVMLAARVFARPSTSSTAAAPLSIPTGTEAAGPAPRRLVVDVEGAVRRPGVYRFETGARVADAIARAGGTTRRADRALVNLAAPLADGQQLVVPRRGGGAGAGGGSPPAPAGPVDLNTASVEQLDELPGIGPVTAQKIVDYRAEHGPFTSVDQLDAISGIGPSRIDNLRGHVVP
jgi:competence protein ComEA